MIEPHTLKITAETLALIAEIDEFKGAWKALGTLAPEKLVRLKKVATIESIGSSTRIEGNKLSDAEIEIILGNLKIQKFESRDEQEVAGYAEVMNLIFLNHEDIPVSERFIQEMHQRLLKYSNKDSWHRGKYKTNPNNVVAMDEKRNHIGVIFETVSPFETPMKMRELVEWTAAQLLSRQLHPLLVIAIFIVIFLAIHPFQDGNGRLSRVLTTYLLLKSGYYYVPYSSLEAIVEMQKQEYYLALRSTQATINFPEPEWQSWISFFLKSLKKQKDNLAVKVEREHILLAHLPEISQNIIELAHSRGRITIGEVQKLFNYNRNTLKKHFENLVNENRIQKNGVGKGTWYTLPM